MTESVPSSPSPSGDHTLIVIPTYNEMATLPTILGDIWVNVPGAHVLIVDDSSPDGTGEWVDNRREGEDRLHVLHRPAKSGLATAYVDGMGWGIDHGYPFILQMDADGSHAPEELHRLLEQIALGADLVIGSRYVPGGKVVNWPKQRWVLSKGGNVYISVALGAGLKDMTAGYRAFRRQVLETVDLDELSNAGYIFQVDMAWRVVQEGFDVREVPITFTERAIGESKLDGSFVKDSLLEVTKWGIRHRKQQVTGLAREMRRLGAKGIQNWRKKHMI